MAELKTRDGSTPKKSAASIKETETTEKKTTAKKPATRKDENGKTVITAKDKGNATGKRVAAVILWVLAIACEIVGILSYFGKISITFIGTLTFIIAVLVLDLIFVVCGSLLWKNANHIDPISKKNSVKFFLYNNMGLIVACFAFIPYLIILIKDKDKLDKKTKLIAVIAAVVALLIGGLTGIDYNPVSEESKAEAVQEIDGDVYWTQFGKVYHTHSDCQHINRSDSYYEGTVEEAIDNNRTRLCKTCAKDDGIAIEAIED